MILSKGYVCPATTAVGERKRDVSLSFDDLEVQVSCLEDVLVSLAARVGPLLEQGNGECTNKAPTTDYTSDFGRAISNVTSRIIACSEQVNFYNRNLGV